LACNVKEKQMKATSVIFALILLNTTAHAQTPKSDSSGTTQETTPISGIDEAAYAGSARASKLIGSKVYKGDTTIGSIEDVLVNLDDSHVSAVILSVGGFLGMGDKLVAIPVSQLKIGSEAKFATDLTKEQLARAPAFDFGNLK
jgi:sporulation protein YlmC with PRC-barrel domain